MSDFGEPWGVADVYEWGPTLTERGHAVIARAPTASSWQWRALERAVACTNALAGISDPAAFVERAKAIMALMQRHEWNLFSELSPAEIAALAAEWEPDA